MNGAGLGSKYLVELGKTVQTVTCSFCGSSCSRHGSIAPPPLSVSPRCFEYHSRIWSRFADLKKIPPIPRMRPRCSVFTGGFDFSGCGDFTSCPPIELAEMNNKEPSKIVVQYILRMRGMIQFGIRHGLSEAPTSSRRRPASDRRNPSPQTHASAKACWRVRV